MNSNSQKPALQTSHVANADSATGHSTNSVAVHVQDDRYPGSFFRVPGVPMPGKTTWSIVK